MKRRTFLGAYRNPHQRNIHRCFTHYLLWQIGYYNDPYPPVPPPDYFRYPALAHPIDPTQPSLIWINHSTYLFQIGGKHFLTDPIWSERCSPLSFIGPKRRHPPPIEIDALPKIDYVIISHNHYDHLDRPTVERLIARHPEIVWIVPRGVRGWIERKLNTTRTVELDWWERQQVEGIDFTAVPAQHFSGRGLFDRNRSLWMGCVVEFQGKRLYFAGDTGYNSHQFKEIGDHFLEIDLSLLPIGVYTPRRFMRGVHVNPADSVKIHQEVRSKRSVGGHWWTFRLSNEMSDRPPYDLACALEKAEIPLDAFCVLQPGEGINW